MFKEYIKEHLNRVIGSTCGLIVGVLFLTIGFWSTLLLALCVFTGYYLGGGAKNRLRIIEYLNRTYKAVIGLIKGK